MKRIFYIPVLITCLFASCEEQVPEPVIDTGEGVLVNILPPRVVSADRQHTRADWPDNGEAKVRMPANSTIRLYIFNTESTSGIPNPASRNLLKHQAFRVRGLDEIDSSSDKRAVIPCHVDKVTGEPMGDITDTDLHLPGSLYDFFAISPAVLLDSVAIDNIKAPALQFRHGGIMPAGADEPVTVYTSKPCMGVQVGSSDPHVTGGTAGVYNLELEPFTLLSTRVRFIIIPGKDIYNLKIEDRGVVMSNLSYNAFRHNFVIGDPELRPMTFPVGQEPVPGEVSIRNARNVTGKEKGYEAGIHEKEDTWELVTEIIPSQEPLLHTDVGLMFNLLINDGNYKAYSSQLMNQRFLRGSEYTYEVTVNAGGIFVRGWRNAGWTATIPL